MFDRIKKAILGDSKQPADATPSQLSHGPASEWAASRSLGMGARPGGGAVARQGKIAGRPWKLELGKPTRNYIHGEEVRARAELGVAEDVAAMVINRPLKDALERKAYSMITDTLQTTADPNLPEEMRWLAMYDEVGWDSLPGKFWERYAVLADRREHALAWMEPAFAQLLLEWPDPPPAADVPFMVVLLRGKCYLRMQSEGATDKTLDHATAIFTAGCECALGAFGGK